MEQMKMDRPNVANPLLRRIANYRASVLWSMAVLLTASPRSLYRSSQVAPRLGRLQTRLSSQPQADRLRHRLGQRLVGLGKERAILTGSLTMGADHYLVRIVRTQNEDGEDVQIEGDVERIEQGHTAERFAADDEWDLGTTQDHA